MPDLEYIRKLLAYVGSTYHERKLLTFIKDDPLLMRIPREERHGDYCSLIFNFDDPEFFYWRTWDESHHNGTVYNDKQGKIVMEEKDYIDLTKYLEKKAYKKAQVEYEEKKKQEREQEIHDFMNQELSKVE